MNDSSLAYGAGLMGNWAHVEEEAGPAGCLSASPSPGAGGPRAQPTGRAGTLAQGLRKKHVERDGHHQIH